MNDASHERRANERDEQDLVAQKRSALWAYIMGAAAVIGMCLSVVGVYLVYTTFQATREANKIGQDALMAEHRPRIVIRRVDFKQCERGIYGSFTATNIGGSDAIFHAAGCWIYCIKGPLPAIPPYEGKYRTYAGNILPLRAQPKSSRVRPRGAKMNSGDWMKFHFIAREFIEINNQDGYSYGPRYYIMGWVDYRQASGNYVRRTSFCREIGDGPSTTLKAVENADYEHQD
ncbi:hypothetical protein FHS91_003222 [Sphingobium xanthum]|uniref:hypothetical protein n=2 Tax=Sphingobium xanthum TaxID=1387165 RepID=UPI001C8B496B|nr:hypothetical protein [Sphingobium xanthum]